GGAVVARRRATSIDAVLVEGFFTACPPRRDGLAPVGMRSMMFILLFASACASTPRVGANIPAIRHQIDDAIAADPALARRTSNFEYEGAPGTSEASSQLPASRR